MDRILKIIKKAGSGAVEAGNPMVMLFGSVTNDNPLEVNVDQRFSLTEDFLIVPESLTHFEIDLKHLHAYQDKSDSGDASRNTKSLCWSLSSFVAVLRLAMQFYCFGCKAVNSTSFWTGW